MTSTPPVSASGDPSAPDPGADTEGVGGSTRASRSRTGSTRPAGEDPAAGSGGERSAADPGRPRKAPARKRPPGEPSGQARTGQVTPKQGGTKQGAAKEPAARQAQAKQAQARQAPTKQAQARQAPTKQAQAKQGSATQTAARQAPAAGSADPTAPTQAAVRPGADDDATDRVAPAPRRSARPDDPTTAGTPVRQAPAAAGVAAPVAAAAAAPAAEPAPRRVMGYRRQRFEARKVRRLVRHIDPWSMLKLSVMVALCMWLITMIASVILWTVASNSGTITSVEDFVNSSLQLQDWTLDGEFLFRQFGLISLLFFLGMAASLVVATLVFNLISDIIGGIWISVIEEETARPVSDAPRR